jgi:signal transduction histidine kinase/integral membrane sensor domain MASE1
VAAARAAPARGTTMSGLPRRPVFDVAVTAGVALAYFAAARLGLSMALVAEQVTVVWPPTGIAVAALVRLGPRAAAGVFAGALAANLTIGEPLPTAALIALGNTSAGLAAWWLLRRVHFNPALERIWDVMALLGLAGGAAAALSATIGVTALCATGLQRWSDFDVLWWIWWLGDAMGVVLVAPVLLTLSRRARWPLARAAEAALLFASLSAVALVVFAGKIPPAGQQLAYAVFPFVVWAALRFRQRETATAIALVAVMALSGTVHGSGPFAGHGVHQRLVLVQLFMAVVAGTGLVLAAAIAERRTAERRRAADYEITLVLARSASLEAAAADILRTICECLHWDVGAVWTPRPDGALRCLEVWHRPAVSAPRFLQATRERAFAPGQGLPGRVWASGEAQWIPDVVQEASAPRAPVAAAEGLHAAFAFPIRVDREVAGVIEFFSREVRRPDGDLLRLFSAVGVHIGQFMARQRTDEERSRLLGELREASQAKDQFLAVLGHELRNPLAPMRNALEVMRARGFPDPATERMGQVMERQLRHMVRLVDDLLDVSRITRGRIELRRERLDLRDALVRAVEAARPLLEARPHALEVSPGGEPLVVDADPTRLEQVIANLLHNAIRYTPDGGAIVLHASREQDEAVLRVADSGAGLAAGMLERIFEPFVRSERAPRRAPEGLGIGLTLVRSLVQMHGGSVRATSAGPGRGSEFTVRLPLAAARIEPAAAPSGEAAESPAPAPGPRKRLLIVDDNVDGAESLAIVLRQHGHDVVTAHDGRTGLARARDAAFDVVLLDIDLPDGLDGYEVARRLRADGPQAPRVLIALTGFGQQEDQARSLAAGFFRHLVKPVDPAALRDLLDRL